MDDRTTRLLEEIRDEVKNLGVQYALAREKQAEGVEIARAARRTSTRFGIVMAIVITLWLLLSLWR